MPFPAEPVPDGNILVSHHYTWAMLLVLFSLAVIWDNYDRREPLLGAGAALIGLISFIFVWPTHHVLGAVLAVSAPFVVMLGAGSRLVTQTAIAERLRLGENLYPWYWLAIAIVFALIAADDAVDHAFHFGTPLDFVWNEFLRPLLPSH